MNSFRFIRPRKITGQKSRNYDLVARESTVTEVPTVSIQGPIIERTFNTIDPLTEIYGPENPDQGNTVITEVGKAINDLIHVIPPVLPLSLFGLTGLFLLLDYAVNYARSQIYIAELYSGIPKSVVDIVEIDAVDPKTLFYIPKNTSFIGLNLNIFDSLVEQTMFGSRIAITEKKQKEMKTYEYLIEQAMNQVNINAVTDQNKGVVTGKARFRTSELSSKSSDCIISVNAFQRLRRRIQQKFKGQTVPMQLKLLDDEQTSLFKEIYRVLRPGGLFCFYEAIDESNVAEDGSDFSFVKYLQQTFPKEIKSYIEDEGNTSNASPPLPPVNPVEHGKKGKKQRKNSDIKVESPVSPPLKMIVKPAIVYQVRPTLPWRKYVIGIAIKPFN